MPNLTCTLTFVGRCTLLRRSSILHLSLHNFASYSSVLSTLFGVRHLCPFEIAKPTRDRDRHLFKYRQRKIGQRYQGTRSLLDEKTISILSHCQSSSLGVYRWLLLTAFNLPLHVARQRKRYGTLMPRRLWRVLVHNLDYKLYGEVHELQ
jgi:hypothetical protein